MNEEPEIQWPHLKSTDFDSETIPVMPKSLFMTFDFRPIEQKLVEGIDQFTLAIKGMQYTLDLMGAQVRYTRKRLPKGWRRHVRRCKAWGLPYERKSRSRTFMIRGRVGKVTKKEDE